jgi:hypothetical protein
LVWRFERNGTSVIYTLAVWPWAALFFATIDGVTSNPNKNLQPDGVIPATGATYTHENPVVSGVIANIAASWQ